MSERTVTNARIITDSISPAGVRLTTIEVTFHRFVLAEFNTHRVFSRNSASSRAIPVEKQLKRVTFDPAFPLEWASEQPGMQGGTELEGDALDDAKKLFTDVWASTIDKIGAYLEARPDKSERLHKSLVNRLLEPFMWHTVVVTATEWDGFWHQRCSPLAQPEIRAAAEAMLHDAYEASIPVPLGYGDWHLPFIQDDERELDVETQKQISVGRCARVSYLTHDGRRDHSEDVALYTRLVEADPMHASPLEHVATPCFTCSDSQFDFDHHQHLGNFRGWRQLRHQIEA